MSRDRTEPLEPTHRLAIVPNEVFRWLVEEGCISSEGWPLLPRPTDRAAAADGEPAESHADASLAEALARAATGVVRAVRSDRHGSSRAADSRSADRIKLALNAVDACVARLHSLISIAEVELRKAGAAPAEPTDAPSLT